MKNKCEFVSRDATSPSLLNQYIIIIHMMLLPFPIFPLQKALSFIQSSLVIIVIDKTKPKSATPTNHNLGFSFGCIQKHPTFRFKLRKSTHHHHQTRFLQDEPNRNNSSIMSTNPQSLLSFSSSIQLLFGAKAVALRLLRRARWLRVPFRYSILLFLPPLLFFASTHHRSFFLHFLSLIAFSSVLIISFHYAHPRFPSVRLLLNLHSSISPPNPRTPIVWCIDSKTNSEKTEKSGSWVKAYKNGDVYEGEFYKGKSSGSGVYYYYMSGRYEGDWVDEKYDGYGVETWAKGSRYRGEYARGLRHGFGVYRFYTGDLYSGEWCNGQCHGFGVHTCNDGSWYVGEFKYGVKHGLGHYHFRNGDTYGGEYFGDKIHGFGVYRFASGHRYEGGWHEGRREGLGMYSFRDGDTQFGYWKNGLLNLTQHPSLYTVSHTKVLNAVQEARRVAEKAGSLAKVDERVKRAVELANKSASAARVAAVKAVQNQMHLNNITGHDLAASIV